jgi:3-deoxy-manno-octulosonate cytidylyltransferase (CMP-KDO synthetase)
MIRRVYEQASGSAGLSRVVVATDDDRICSHVRDFGGEVIMTSTHHRSGTERIGEVLEILELSGEEYPVVVNIQGDEPMLDPGQIDRLIQCFRKPETQIGTLAMKIIRDNEFAQSQRG